MAKLSAINKNNKRIKLSDKFYKKRESLKKIIMNKKLTFEERFKAEQNLSKLPRIKDFRGLNKNGFDKFGNYTFGIKEQIVFPEVNFDKVDKIRGLDITMVTNSINRESTLELLKEFNFPITTKKNWGQNGKNKCNTKKFKKN